MNTHTPNIRPELSLDQQLHDLIQAGTSPSTRRAYERDARYFWAWAHLRCHVVKHYPIEMALVQQFILDHVQVMPEDLDQLLVLEKAKAKPGPLKLSTIKRYLATLSALQQEHGHASILANAQIKLLLRRARIATRTHQKTNQKAAITKNILERMVATCDESLRGIRDKAILMTGFASGGRRRDELVNLNVQDISPINNGYLLYLYKSKTDQVGDGFHAPVLGAAAQALQDWLEKSQLVDGRLFRGIRTNDTLNEYISGRAINLMVKRRIELIGLNPNGYGAHSLRSGFVTEAANMGLSVKHIMQLTGHVDQKVALDYCRATELDKNPLAKLL